MSGETTTSPGDERRIRPIALAGGPKGYGPRKGSRARPSPAARARRALAVDLVAGAGLAAVILILAAGLGVIAFFGLPILLVGLVWISIEGAFARLRRRRASGGVSSAGNDRGQAAKR